MHKLNGNDPISQNHIHTELDKDTSPENKLTSQFD
jgi:hypothetical protein